MGLFDPRAPWNVSPLDVYDEVNKSEWRGPDGTLKGSAIVLKKHMSRRPQYSKSLLRQLSGTSTLWRPPTSYRRVVFSNVTHRNVMLRQVVSGVPGDTFTSPMATDTFRTVMSFLKLRNIPYYSGIDETTAAFSGPDETNDYNRAVTECLNKLSDNKVDVGVALAELSKTMRHLTSTALDLWGSIDCLRKKNFRGLFRILSKRSPLHSRRITVGKTAAQYWLEYNYAWKPLINEAYGLYQLLTEQLKPALLVHANRTVAGEISVNEMNRVDPNGNWRTIRYSFSGRIRRRTTVRLTGRVNSDLLRGVAKGMTNPAVVLWELVPYSFVVDWSMPIGSVLEAATATRGLTFVGGSHTRRFQTHLSVVMEGAESPGVVTVQQGHAEIMKFAMLREVYSAFPRPLLYAKNPFSTSHLASAVALFRQLI